MSSSLNSSSTTKAAILTVGAILLSSAAVAFAASSNNKKQIAPAMSSKSKPALPDGTIESSFANERSQKIHTIHLPCKSSSPKATVFFLHGVGDHCGRPCYCRLYKKLVQQNVQVFSMDHHGHGLSEGQPRAYCDKFQDYVDDYASYIQAKCPGDDGPPVILVGHSLGGLMSILLAQQLGPKVHAVVLTAPACGVEMNLEKKVQKFLAPVIDTLLPKAQLVDAVRVEDLTRDVEEIKAYQQDDLITKGKLCARTGIQTMETFGRLPQIQGDITCPLLVLHGKEDKCTEMGASLNFFQKVGTSPNKKLFVKLIGFYHELYNEPERDLVLDMVMEFVASGGTKFPDGAIGEDRVLELDLVKPK